MTAAHPFLSVIVISYETSRELPRTLYSLSPRFQQGIDADDYEVIVVDNGSRQPPRVEDFTPSGLDSSGLDSSGLDSLGLDLSVHVMDDPTPSPVRAVNHGLNLACGAAIGVFIDGARMASPGLLRRTREALGMHPRAVVGSRGRYLGPLMQRRAMRFGYDQDLEDRLLDSIDWQRNGYDLFTISIFDETSRPVWHAQVGETNALFMSRPMWRELGGYDERFTSPGGGFVNLDTWERACHLPDAHPILLLGEATFHQFHGGIATNAERKADVDVFRQEYIDLHGRDHRRPTVPVSFWGAFVSPPPVDELFWDGPAPLPDRMASGPMKDLLDMSRPVRERAQREAKGPRQGTTRSGSTPTVPMSRRRQLIRRIGRSMPRSMSQLLIRAGRRLPSPLKQRLKRLVGR